MREKDKKRRLHKICSHNNMADVFSVHSGVEKNNGASQHTFEFHKIIFCFLKFINEISRLEYSTES